MLKKRTHLAACLSLVLLLAVIFTLQSMTAEAAGGDPPESGWYQDENGDYFYYEEGSLVVNAFRVINGKYYYFFDDGRMAYDTTFSVYDEEGDGWYRARSDGSLYVKAWYKETSEWFDTVCWYYYGENGKAASGYTNVGGVYYYFDPDGQMNVNPALSPFFREGRAFSWLIFRQQTGDTEIRNDFETPCSRNGLYRGKGLKKREQDGIMRNIS